MTTSVLPPSIPPPSIGPPSMVPPEPSFDSAFLRETLVTQRLRVKIIIGGFAAFLFVGLALSIHGLIDPAGSDIADEVRSLRWWCRFGVVAGVVVYELAAHAYLGRLLARARPLPLAARLVNAALETSFPTLLLLLSSRHPVLRLGGAVPLEYLFFIVLSGLQLDFWVSAWTGIVAATEYMLFAAWAVRQPGLGPHSPEMLDLSTAYGSTTFIILVTAAVAGLVGRQIKKQQQNAVRATEDRDRTRRTFGQHVSPRVVDRLLALGAAPSEETRTVCVMFLDIRGFTTFSEKRSPTEVVSFLNSLFEPMIRSINRHNGLVNKFLGDGFMAVFGAPLSDGRDCENAVRAAREIVDGVERRVACGELPPTQIGIGLHVGPAMTGEIGSPERREYTVIGDVVNLASRIEGLNKEYGSSLLVSEDVMDASGAEPPTDPAARKLAKVKGRDALVAVYSLA